MSKIMRNAWLPLLIVAVVVVGGFAVVRVKSFYTQAQEDDLTSAKVDDAKPFKPKVVKYEIFGSASHAAVNYLDLSAEPQRLDNAALPWTMVLSTTAPSVFPNISAQSDGDYLGCRITIDDEENATYTPDETTANILAHTSIDAPAQVTA